MIYWIGNSSEPHSSSVYSLFPLVRHLFLLVSLLLYWDGLFLHSVMHSALLTPGFPILYLWFLSLGLCQFYPWPSWFLSTGCVHSRLLFYFSKRLSTSLVPWVPITSRSLGWRNRSRAAVIVQHVSTCFPCCWPGFNHWVNPISFAKIGGFTPQN